MFRALRSSQDTTVLGILLMIAAIFAFTVMDVIAKLLTDRYDPMMVVWARYISQVVWSVILLSPILLRILRTQFWGLQVIRSLLIFGATFCFYTALSGLQLAEATAIFEVAPLIVTALAVLILGEKVGPRRWIGVGAGLIGALIIIRPGTDVFSAYAVFPLLAASCYAGYMIATRFLGTSESPWTSFIYTAVFGALASSIMVPPVWQTPIGVDLYLMIAIGLVGGTAQLLLILSLRMATASVLAPFGYVGLIFSALWGLMVFGEFPDAATWAGALVIVGAGLYVWYRERQAAQSV